MGTSSRKIVTRGSRRSGTKSEGSGLKVQQALSQLQEAGAEPSEEGLKRPVQKRRRKKKKETLLNWPRSEKSKYDRRKKGEKEGGSLEHTLRMYDKYMKETRT